MKDRLLDHFGHVAPLLEPITHLYPVELKAFAHLPSASCFNPRVVLESDETRRPLSQCVEIAGIDPHKPHWLFVLSEEDFGGATGRMGTAHFADVLVKRLADTVAAKRQPIVLAAQACLDALGRCPGLAADARLLPFCSYQAFLSLLLDAEYVFYWNIFSQSIIDRVMNRLPPFFFDRGHLARAMPAVLRLGIENYYAGAEPAYLDLEEPLVPSKLATIAASEDRRFENARARFSSSWSPLELVESLVEARAANVARSAAGP